MAALRASRSAVLQSSLNCESNRIRLDQTWLILFSYKSKLLGDTAKVPRSAKMGVARGLSSGSPLEHVQILLTAETENLWIGEWHWHWLKLEQSQLNHKIAGPAGTRRGCRWRRRPSRGRAGRQKSSFLAFLASVHEPKWIFQPLNLIFYTGTIEAFSNKQQLWSKNTICDF